MGIGMGSSRTVLDLEDTSLWPWPCNGLEHVVLEHVPASYTVVTKTVGVEAHECEQLAQSRSMQPRPGRGSNPRPIDRKHGVIYIYIYIYIYMFL